MSVRLSAQAFFEDNFYFTITGGASQGFYVPCINIGHDSPNGASGFISFAGDGLSMPGIRGRPADNCSPTFPGTPQLPLIPFTFGVPQTVTETISGAMDEDAGPNTAVAIGSLYGFEFFDANQNPITGVCMISPCANGVAFTLVSTSLPEPSTLSLLGIALALSLVLRFRAARPHAP